MSQWHDFSGLIPAMFTTFFYYGVMQIAIDVENPFNFADVDHDLDSFSKRLHDETLVVAREVAPPGTRCRDYWITERKFAARERVKAQEEEAHGRGLLQAGLRKARDVPRRTLRARRDDGFPRRLGARRDDFKFNSV